MDIKKIRVKNLNALLANFEGSREKFAERCGYGGVNYVNQLLTGNGSFGGRTAKKISLRFGRDEGWMDRIHNIGVREPLSDYVTDYQNTQPATQQNTTVPVISSVQAGDFDEAIDLFSPGYAEEYISRINGGPRVFALYVKGDSMTAPPGVTPSFPEGYIIHADPDQTAVCGDCVIAKVKDRNQVTFKQLKYDGDKPYLKPLNPSHPPIFDSFTIVAKVIGASIKF